MLLSEIDRAAGSHHLEILGVAQAAKGEPVPSGTSQVVLLGPREPGFWRHVTAQPEWLDSHADPIDRWSARATTDIAHQVGGAAILPFGDPPYAPFVDWALRSGRAWTSPVSLLVHDKAGLMVSFRGAIALTGTITRATPSVSPCTACTDRPCLSACPVAALTDAGYDLGACHQYLDTDNGRDCMQAGCRVRGACPVSDTYGRLPEQSAHHMKAFHK